MVGDRATASGESGLTTPQRRHGDVTEATLGRRRGVACCVDVAAPPPGHVRVTSTSSAASSSLATSISE
jgi:hypothetical protein